MAVSPSKSHSDDPVLSPGGDNVSATGSPPLSREKSSLGAETPGSEYFSAPDVPPKPALPTAPSKLTKENRSPQSAAANRRIGTRSASKSGGMQVVLGETGSWSQLADKTATLPAEGVKGVGKAMPKPTGMLGFLSRKGGRARSPKPREAGVLGKEGARVVINSGGR